MAIETNQEHLDTDLAIPTPEYIVFRYNMAGPISRFFAVMLDQFFIIMMIIGVVFVLSILGVITSIGALSMEPGYLVLFLMFMAIFVINWFYFFLFEWLNRGRTPGKMILSLRVVALDGTSLDVVQIAVRNLLRVADMFPMPALGMAFTATYGIAGLTTFITGKSFQRLGDLAAGTVVIRRKREVNDRISVVDHPRIKELAGQLNMRKVPSPTLTQALNDFVARRRRLNAARMREIARAVEERLRNYFAAESLRCTPEELLFAVHYHLFQLPREEMVDVDPRRGGIMDGGR